jgi:hypothetical protein
MVAVCSEIYFLKATKVPTFPGGFFGLLPPKRILRRGRKIECHAKNAESWINPIFCERCDLLFAVFAWKISPTPQNNI